MFSIFVHWYLILITHFSGIHPIHQDAYFSSGPVLIVFHSLQLHTHLPPRITLCEAGYPFTPVQALLDNTFSRDYPSCLPFNSKPHLGDSGGGLQNSTEPSWSSRPSTKSALIPHDVHFHILQLAYTHSFSCHPGYNPTIDLLKRHFWWPQMVAIEFDTLSNSMWLPVLSVLGERLHINHQLAFSNYFLSLAVHGSLSLWTLSPDNLHPKITHTVPQLMLTITSLICLFIYFAYICPHSAAPLGVSLMHLWYCR